MIKTAHSHSTPHSSKSGLLVEKAPAPMPLRIRGAVASKLLQPQLKGCHPSWKSFPTCLISVTSWIVSFVRKTEDDPRRHTNQHEAKHSCLDLDPTFEARLRRAVWFCHCAHSHSTRGHGERRRQAVAHCSASSLRFQCRHRQPARRRTQEAIETKRNPGYCAGTFTDQADCAHLFRPYSARAYRSSSCAHLCDPAAPAPS
jgi:hypothetical protein